MPRNTLQGLPQVTQLARKFWTSVKLMVTKGPFTNDIRTEGEGMTHKSRHA